MTWRYLVTSGLFLWAGVAAAQPNPMRGDTAAIEVGRVTYRAHCAECHGDNASQALAEAPDLRRLDGFCRRLTDPDLRQHCQRDVDTYFLRSVREGKVRAGIVHMPAWKDVLSTADIWAVRSFIETRPPDPPRRTTSVDAARAASAAASAAR